MKKATLALTLALTLGTSMALAEPLITMSGGKASPGVVTAWSGSGKKITLTVKDGADASEVASAIQSNVDRVKAKVSGGKVLVIGKTQDELLKALSEVELGGGGDDLGELAAAAMSDDDSDSGSSLRAKKTAKQDKAFRDRKTVAMGKVEAVKNGKFPNVQVMVRVLRGPIGALGKNVRKGKTVTFTPKLKMKGGTPDLSDEDTLTNLGAWYLEKGDRVQVKIGKATGNGFEAELISR